MASAVIPQQTWLTWGRVTDILQIPEVDIRWLVDTCQLTPRTIRDQEVFNSLDIWRLIQSYRDVAHRRGK